MDDTGIIYVATQRLTFLCEAIASAESAKDVCPNVRITLFTDASGLFQSSIAPFDEIIDIDVPSPSRNTPSLSWGLGLHARILGLLRSPYTRTLHLDSDTRVLSKDVIQVFDYLHDASIALVPCTPGNSRSCRIYGPMFNGGMIAFRRISEVVSLFLGWEALHWFHLELAGQDPPGTVPYLAHFSEAERRFLLTNDQTSLAQFLSPVTNLYNIAVRTLADTWNARNYARDCLDEVVIDHADCHKIEPGDVAGFLRARGLTPRTPHRESGNQHLTPARQPRDTMTTPRDVRSLLEQFAAELVRDPRVVSSADRDLLRRVFSESTGDRALDAAVADRVTAAFAGSIAGRISQLIAFEVVKQLGDLRPVTPADPAIAGPLSATNPFGPLRPFINPIANPGNDPATGPGVSPSNPGNDPATGPGVSPSNPGNDPAAGPGVSPSNPGNDPAGGPGVSPSNPGNDPAARPGSSTAFPGSRDASRVPARVPGVGSRGRKP